MNEYNKNKKKIKLIINGKKILWNILMESKRKTKKKKKSKISLKNKKNNFEISKKKNDKKT